VQEVGHAGILKGRVQVERGALTYSRPGIDPGSVAVSYVLALDTVSSVLEHTILSAACHIFAKS
jgi:hypothetical protein